MEITWNTPDRDAARLPRLTTLASLLSRGDYDPARLPPRDAHRARNLARLLSVELPPPGWRGDGRSVGWRAP